MDTEGQFFCWIGRVCRITNCMDGMLVNNYCKKSVLLTNINSKISNGWKENLDIRSCDELWVHSTSIFKECPAKKSLRSRFSQSRSLNNKNHNPNASHSKPFSHSRQIPHWVDCRFAHVNFNPGVRLTDGSICISARTALQHNLPIH